MSSAWNPSCLADMPRPAPAIEIDQVEPRGALWLAFLALACFALISDVLAPTKAWADHPGIWHLEGLVSKTAEGEPANNQTVNAAVSRDGRWVVFESDATDLIEGDTNNARDVFLADQSGGDIFRISEHIDGTAGAGTAPSISADGRFVAYVSSSASLIGRDTNDDGDCDEGCLTSVTGDIFVRDRDSDENGVFDEDGGIENLLVSVSSSGEQNLSAIGRASNPVVSADGNWVAFASSSPNMVEGDTNTCSGHNFAGHCPDIFVHHIKSGSTVRVSVASDGTQSNGTSGAFPGNPSLAISGDGRFVLFGSRASNLVDGDTNGNDDLFLHDRDSDENEVFDEVAGISTIRISVDEFGQQLPNPRIGQAASMTADARFIAFSSNANLIEGNDDINELGSEVFILDRQTGLLEQTGRRPVGEENCCGNIVSRYALSDSGRFVAFGGTENVRLDDGQLVELRGVSDVFVLDRDEEEVERITTSPIPDDRNDPSLFSSLALLSGDGSTLLFSSSDPAVTGREGAATLDLVAATSALSTTTTTLPAEICGDGDGNGKVLASDALLALRTAVGSGGCASCLCDVDSSGQVSASDALAILRKAVGQDLVFVCSACM